MLKGCIEEVAAAVEAVVEAVVEAETAEELVVCSGVPVAVLCLPESPPPSPPPSAAPITKIPSASTIQNLRFGSPHTRDGGGCGGTGSRPACWRYGIASLDAASSYGEGALLWPAYWCCTDGTPTSRPGCSLG